MSDNSIISNSIIQDARNREIRRTNLDRANPLIKNAILDDDQESGWIQNTWEGVVNGIPAVAASATLSFVNTGISLGNALGANVDEIATEDALRSLGLDTSANYYQQHSEGIDAIGFIAGAVVGGGLAIKGLRALQKGAMMGSSNRFISGLGKLANAPEDVASAAQAIRTGAAPAKVLTNQNINLISKSVAQYSLEGVAASYAPLLTQNQSTFLNKEDLSYFDSMSANFKDSTFDAFVLSPIFGSLGGVFNYGKLNKAVRSVKSAEQNTLSSYVDPIANSAYATEGDSIAATSSEWQAVTKQIAGLEKQNLEGIISETDKNITLPALEKLRSKIQLEQQTKIKNIVSDNDTELQELLSIWGKGENIPASANLFAGAKSVTRVSPAKPTSLPGRVSVLDDIAEDLKGLDDTVTTENVLDILHGENTFSSKVYKQAAKDLDLVNSVDNKFASELLFKAKGGRSNKIVQQQLKNMSKLDRELNPAIWKEIDEIESALNNVDVNTLTKADRLKYLEKRNRYMELHSVSGQFQRIVAGALGKDGVKITRKNKELFDFLSSNGATAKYINGNSLFVDTSTGNTFVENVLPTVGDYGNVKLTRNLRGGKTLKFGNYSADVGQGKYSLANTRQFGNLDELTSTARDKQLREMNAFAIESEAQFVAAQQDARFSLTKEIDSFDLPYLERALIELQKNPNLKAKVSQAGEFDADQLTNFIKTQKQDLINRYTDDSLLGKGQWSQDQLERMLGVDQNFILSGEGNFISMTRDLSKPRHIKVNYGINLGEEIPDAGARLATVRNAITQQHRLAAVSAIKEINPQFSQVLGSIEESLGNITSDLSQLQPGLFSASYAEYGSYAAKAKYIGTAAHKAKLEVRQNVASNIIPLSNTLAKNPKSLQEANAIIERSRMGLYTTTDNFNGNTEIFLNDLAPNLPQIPEVGIIASQLESITKNINNRLDAGSLTAYMPKDISDTVSNHVNKIQDILNDFNSQIIPQNTAARKLQRELSQFSHNLDNLKDFSDDLIPINSPDVLNWVNGHKQINSQYIKGRTALDNVIGKVNTYDPEVLYLGNPDIKGKYVAFVQSPNIAETGTRRHILLADSPEELNNQVNVVKKNYPDFNVYTSRETADYARAKANYEGGTWNFDPSFNAELQRKGSVGRFNPRNDKSEIENANNSLISRQTKLVTDSVETYFAEDMARLDVLANRLDNLYGGRVGDGSIGANYMKNNPARSTKNIILDRQTTNEFQAMAETFITGTIDKVGQAIKSVTGGKERLSDSDFEELQKISKDAGYTHAPVRAVQELVMESNPPSDVARKLVSVVNGAAILTMHRADTFMPILNSLGNVVIGNAEYSRLVKNLSSGEYADWVIRNGNSVELSPAKAMSSAMSDVFGNMEQYLNRYESYGLNVRAAALHKQLREAFAEDFGNFSVNKAQDTMAKWGDWISKVNGSQAIDDFNRAVTARVADKLGLQAGLDEGSLAHRAFINNFVTNVEGTIISSQRPQVFNGVVGQALGLFQSYSLHMTQGLLRNLADGNKRYALQVLAMNGTLFGANSMPGWQQLNQHIIERSNGNGVSLQADINDAVGTDLGDLITYGSVSNILHLGIYNRGRIDLPFINSLGGDLDEKIPSVAILGRAVGAVSQTATNIAANGFDGSYLLEGLSINGISRPIGELAQIAQGYTLTRKGNIGVYHREQSFEDYISDKANWAELGWNLMGAAMGGKALDQSIALDQYYKSYAATAAANNRLADIGAKVKAKVRSGDPITNEDLDELLSKYVGLGKDKKNFNRWMTQQMINAKTSQVNELSTRLTTRGGLQMQRLMGGSDTNITNETFWE